MNKPVDTHVALSDARRLTQRVHFEPDGTVSVATGKVELGQGITTALAQIAAEELGVPLEKIRVLPPSTATSPDEGVTSGSLSIQDGGKGLRKACAELRALLARSGKKSYWELEVAGKDIPAEAPEKPAAEYRVVGTNAPRVDLPGKFAGRAAYVHDMVLPGMLHARLLRPPRPGAQLVSLPDHPGLLRDGSFAAVVAKREEEAIEAAKKLRAKAVWSGAPEIPADYHAWLKAHVTESKVTKESVDEQARARGVTRRVAEYRKPFIAHGSIGPSCAIARMRGDTLEVWSHTQGIFGLRQEIAMVLRMPEEKIVVHHAEGAGCYGHNGADDVGLDAALLTRLLGGKPVRLQWTREDEFAWEPYGPAMAVALDALLDGSGNIVSWRHDLWSNGHTHRPGRSQKPVLLAAGEIADALERAPSIDPPLPSGGAQRNAIPGYEFPDLLVMHHYVREAPMRGSSLRSLGAFANVFAIESFMDELAAAANADPVEFRLRHLKDPRGRAVIEEAVRVSQWSSFENKEGRGRGIAYARYKNIGAYCAVVAEVEAGGAELRVARLVAAVDVGLPVNPDGVVNQVEGGCVQATSWALKEAWRPGAASWEDYPILKFSEAPPVSVSIVRNKLPSLGAGECTMGPTVAAIANALNDALGVRVRELPLTAETIAKAINA
ncbi:MAG TPA: molybdopterin cofactor-binding domain-containing protein [Burkholderiales bacterium]|jgi:CO/xanthine dehydrogenase Mo-binding subunit|nr:molybdopterin cofactor-binding domain-containing protein [Burkholderiales bacterium]